MTTLTSHMLRQYSAQIEQQIDEYADRLDDLESENAGLQQQVAKLEDLLTDARNETREIEREYRAEIADLSEQLRCAEAQL